MVIPSVYEATVQFIPEKERVSSFVWGLFLLSHKVHRMWCFYRKGKIYSNPENFKALLAGHAISCVAGHVRAVRVAAQSVLIATRIAECQEHYVKFSAAYEAWKDALQCTYPVPYERRSEKVMYRMERIGVCGKKIFGEGFQLSMGLMDAMEAYAFSAETQDDAIKELFTNCMQSIDKLVENQAELVEQMQRHRAIVEIILSPHCEIEDVMKHLNKGRSQERYWTASPVEIP